MSTDAWDMVPLALVAQVTLGKMVQNSASELETVEQPYLHAANVRDFGVLDTDHSHRTMWFSPGEVDSLKVKSGDVVVVEGGAVGKSAYVKNDLPGYGFQNSILRVRAKKRVSDGRFIQYSLQSAYDSGEISRQCSSVSLAHFPAEKINRFRVPYPSLETQQRIADYLDRETAEIDAAVADLDRYVELLEKRRQVMIAQSVTRGIGSNRTRVHLRALPGGEGMMNSPTKKVPFWSLLEFINAPVESSSYGVRLEDIDSWTGRLFDNVICDRRDSQGTPFQPGDSLFGKLRPYLAKSWLATTSGVAVGDIHVYRPKPHCEPRFLSYILRTSDFISFAEGASEGVKMPRSEWSKLRQYPIPLPPLETQQRIADYLDRETTEIDSLISESTRLRDLLLKRRSVLITEVVTGRKQV